MATAKAWLRRVVTFGAAKKVEIAIEAYEGELRAAQDLALQLEKKRVKANTTFEALVEVKVSGIGALGRMQDIARNLGVRERQFMPEIVTETSPKITIAKIENTLALASTAISAGKGLSAGTTAAVGSWALANTVAAASTGSAISSLSGAAATNATLAWFGGGSLAAGGLGMAGGTVVLGGIVAAPTLAIMACFAHARANRKVAEIEEESLKIDRAVDEMRNLELFVDVANRRAHELIAVITKSRNVYEDEFRTLHRRLYRWAWLSRAWRWWRSKLGGRYFRSEEVEEISKLLQVASTFAHMLDQRVFDEDGRVLETTK